MDDKTVGKEDSTKFDEKEIVAWIGVDWADKEHSVAEYEVATGKTKQYKVKHTPEALQEWLVKMRERYSGSKVGVALEQSRGALLYALMSCEFVVLYPINPQSLASYRKAFHTSGAKDDPLDAELLSAMVRKHPDRFRAWKPEDTDTRSLRLLVEGRRKLVNETTKLTNRLTIELKNYYPLALELAGDLNSRQACDFLQKWPTLEDLQQARPSTIEKFYLSYGRPTAEAIDKRVERIKQATALTRDRAVLLAGSMMVKSLISQIRTLVITIEKYDDQISQLFQKHPDRHLFESFKGAGAVLAPRLLAAMGADRDRWQSAADIQQLSGIAPVTEQSGRQRWVHIRWACPKFLRQTFHEFADQTTRWCDWAKAYYEQLRERGKGHNTALRALAYKWIRIIFRCWKNRVPYDDALFMSSLQKRNPQLAKRAYEIRQAREFRLLA